MSKYVPKTDAIQRKLIKANVNKSAWTDALLADLTSCEACLAEADREVDRLSRENKVIKTCDTKNEANYKAMLMAVHRIAELVGMDACNSPAEIVSKVQQLLNSEGRDGK